MCKWDPFFEETEPQYPDNAGVFHHTLYEQKRADDNIQLRKWLIEDGLASPPPPPEDEW